MNEGATSGDAPPSVHGRRAHALPLYVRPVRGCVNGL